MKWFQWALLLAIAPVYFFYVWNTHIQERSHDVPGHLQHMEMIEKGIWLPKTNDCWQCYQPPLYYWALELLKRTFSEFFSSVTIEKQYQIHSFLFYLIFLISGLRTLSFFSSSKVYLFIASMIFLLLPSSIVHSARMGNDSAFYAFSGLSLYWFGLSRFSSEIQKRHVFFFLSAVGAFFASFSKQNGMLLFVLLLVSWLSEHWRFRSLCVRSLFREWGKPLGLLVFVITFTLQMILVSYKTQINSRLGYLGDSLRVPNSVSYYLTLSLDRLLDSPFVFPFSNEGGREYFWIYSLKTLIFSEFNLGLSWPLSIGIYWGIFTIFILVIFLGLGKAIWHFYARSPHWPFAFFIFLSFSASVLFRMKYPFACSQDFRYIYTIWPLLVGFAVVRSPLRNK